MFDRERFIADCRAVLKEQASELAIEELVARAVSEPGQVERALGTPQWAQIVTLHRSPELTVLNVIWAPGMSIYPHDHRMWAVIGLYGGQEDNAFYRRHPQKGLVQAGAKQLATRDVAVLGSEVIHAVTNPLGRFTGALHIYGGDFFATPRSEWDPQTFAERPYDVEKAKRVFLEANQGAQTRPEAQGSPTKP